MERGYRSYLVRVWRRRPPPAAPIHVLVEEIQSGRQAELRGRAAADVAAPVEGALAGTGAGAAAGRVHGDAGGGGRMILVVGATGSVGGRIARGLLGRGHQVRVLVRPGSAYGPLLEAGAEAAQGDLRDPASLAAACRGVETLVTTAISLGRAAPDTVETVELDGYRSLFEAARSAGVRHVVYTSMLEADTRSPVPFVAAKAVTEQRLRDSGLAWTILAPDVFMDVWLTAVVAGPALSGGDVWYVGSGRRRHSFVHGADVAAFAVAAVDDPAAIGRRLAIGGPEALTLHDVVGVFGSLLGRTIAEHGVQPGEPVPGLPPLMAGMLGMLDASESVLPMEELAAEFGVRLTSVREWAQSLVPVGTR